MFRIIVVLLVFFICTSDSNAKHIIGGVMYYEFIRNQDNINTYRIVLKMYRDCKPEQDKAGFDGLVNETPAFATIFRGLNSFYSNLDFGRPNVKRLDLEITNKCLVLPPDVCVEEGIYTVDINLPVSSQSYHISYQRCCRNNSITNLVNPGDVGATFTVEITPLAQQEKNSSPQFINFPPIAICANFPVEFDHMAIDKDGDSLVYSLCAPFIGGGNEMDNQGCFVVAPDPDCPPPYDEAVYRAPYSAANPLGGNPILNINRETGFLSGTPIVAGQFVVGICISEYRAGKLLSVIRRDFQFNVTSCSKTVDALVEIFGIEGKDIEIKVCGDSLVNINNISTVEANIFQYSWNFDFNGTKQTGSIKNFQVKTPETGVYKGNLILNEGLPCSDTARITLNVFPDIRADFTSLYDTCLGKVIDFTNTSESDAGPITSSVWKANNVVFSTSFNSRFNTLAPDFYAMKLTVSDQNECLDSITKEIPFFPIPKDELIDPGALVGCDPFRVQFARPNSYITGEYDIVWDFGDGNKGTGISPVHIYVEPGVYSVGVSVTNVFKCSTSAQFPQTVTVKESPEAAFNFSPKELSNLSPTMTISDLSKNGAFYFYDFGDGSTSADQNPVYTYADTGYYNITQIVTHENGCKDTFQLLVDVSPKYTLYLPNAFIIGSPGENSEFGPVGIPFGIKEYTMWIFDRWGGRVYEGNSFESKWDGKDKNGNSLPKGVYSVKIELTEPRGSRRTIYGSAVLVE